MSWYLTLDDSKQEKLTRVSLTDRRLGDVSDFETDFIEFKKVF